MHGRSGRSYRVAVRVYIVLASCNVIWDLAVTTLALGVVEIPKQYFPI